MMRRTSVAGWPSETNRSANRVASRSGAVPTFDFANDAETEPQGSFLRHRRHPRPTDAPDLKRPAADRLGLVVAQSFGPSLSPAMDPYGTARQQAAPVLASHPLAPVTKFVSINGHTVRANARHGTCTPPIRIARSRTDSNAGAILDQLGPLASPELDRSDTHRTLHLGGAVLDQPEHLAALDGAQGAHHGGVDFLDVLGAAIRGNNARNANLDCLWLGHCRHLFMPP